PRRDERRRNQGRQGDRARPRSRARRGRCRRRHRDHLRLDDPVRRPAAGAPKRAPRHPVARLRAYGSRRVLRPARPDPGLRSRQVMLAANPLISVTPGLMIWTIVCFLIALFVLKRYAFRPIQKLIDSRREQIRRSLEEADHAREEARRLLEEHRKLIGQARSEAEQILAEARRTGEAMEHRMREETETERQRRIEETRREIAAETARALEKIRAEVADLTLEATAIVVGRKLDPETDRELITEAIGSLDFSRLEDSR